MLVDLSIVDMLLRYEMLPLTLDARFSKELQASFDEGFARQFSIKKGVLSNCCNCSSRLDEGR